MTCFTVESRTETWGNKIGIFLKRDVDDLYLNILPHHNFFSWSKICHQMEISVTERNKDKIKAKNEWFSVVILTNLLSFKQIWYNFKSLEIMHWYKLINIHYDTPIYLRLSNYNLWIVKKKWKDNIKLLYIIIINHRLVTDIITVF